MRIGTINNHTSHLVPGTSELSLAINSFERGMDQWKGHSAEPYLEVNLFSYIRRREAKAE